MSLQDQRTTLETAWLTTRERQRREESFESDVAEQAAYEAYTEICDELGQCIRAGCTNASPEHVLCTDHRNDAS